MPVRFSLLVLMLLCTTTRADGPQRISQAALDAAAKVVRTEVARKSIAGGAHMVYRNGKIVHFLVVGAKDLESKAALKKDTIMRVYSMSKPITSVAAMTLWEKRKFKLDDPVSKYIPSWKNIQVISKNGNKTKLVNTKRQITVRDLFRHTSGYSYGAGAMDPIYRQQGMRYHKPKGMFPPRKTIAEAVESLAKVPILHQPGARFTYGFNTDVLGRLVEIWSGMTLDQYFHRAIFKPLQMSDTGFVVPSDKRDRFASCHTIENKKIVVVDKAASSPFTRGFKFLSGGGGLVSTMGDYGRFCEMLVRGGSYQGRRVLKPATLKLVFTDQLAKDGKNGPFQFGLGFAIREATIAGGKKVPVYYWGGYANTGFQVIPSLGMYQVFMRQLVPSTHRVSNKVFQLVNAGVQP